MDHHPRDREVKRLRGDLAAGAEFGEDDEGDEPWHDREGRVGELGETPANGVGRAVSRSEADGALWTTTKSVVQ
jgi:hypothetical protein